MENLSISRFWDKYILKTSSYDIKDERIKWYVRDAEHYINAHKNKRLALHVLEDVEFYLKKQGRKLRIEDWQFKQIVVALNILFVDMVQIDWAKSFPWDEWKDQAQELTSGHPTKSC